MGSNASFERVNDVASLPLTQLTCSLQSLYFQLCVRRLIEVGVGKGNEANDLLTLFCHHHEAESTVREDLEHADQVVRPCEVHFLAIGREERFEFLKVTSLRDTGS